MYNMVFFQSSQQQVTYETFLKVIDILHTITEIDIFSELDLLQNDFK